MEKKKNKDNFTFHLVSFNPANLSLEEKYLICILIPERVNEVPPQINK